MITGKLNYPDLGLPLAEEVAAYRAIVKIFKNDQIFGRAVNTWVTWDGSNIDDTDPAYALCPYCRISPFPSESSWITNDQHSMPLILRITLAVQGTNFDQIGNFWGAMRRALFPKNNATQRAIVMDTLTTADITRPTIQVSAYGQNTEASGLKMMVADGTIKFGMKIYT